LREKKCPLKNIFGTGGSKKPRLQFNKKKARNQGAYIKKHMERIAK